MQVNTLDSDLYDVTDGYDVTCPLYKALAHFGYMEQAVVMYAYIHECTEINYVSYRSLEEHIGLQILYVQNVCTENGRRCAVTNISSGLFELSDDVEQSRLTAAELVAHTLHSVFCNLKTQGIDISRLHVLLCKVEFIEQVLGYFIGLGVNSRIVENFL